MALHSIVALLVLALLHGCWAVTPPTEQEIWDRAVDRGEKEGKADGLRELGGMYFAGSTFQGTTIPQNKKKARKLWDRG